MLKLIQSNQMEVLCAHLAAYLRQRVPNARLLQSEHILVQSPGMSTWLRLEIAKQNGVAAALEFPLPSSFTWQLCHELLPNVPKDNAFTKAAMTWKLMQLLPKLLADETFGPLRHYLASCSPELTQANTETHTQTDEPLDQIKLYQLCGRIADIFDQYLVYRPDWMLAWEQNAQPEGLQLNEEQAWQPRLWRALVAFNRDELKQSYYHRANLHSDLIARLGDPATSLAKLPQRLFVFGISSMAPQTLEVLYHLAGRIDVVILGLSPCQHYWGDIVDPRHRARMAVQYAGKRQLAEQWEDKLEVGNPLLANNGKMGRELLDMLLELPSDHCDFGHDVYREPCDNPNDPQNRASMLHGVQYDILEMQTLDRVLGPDTTLYQNTSARRILKQDDESISIISCHSPLREVETLHDHLLDLLDRHSQGQATDPLLPKDIVVMMPDVAAYAPYIDAVFAAKQGLEYIPYAIADRGAAQESPLINSFLNLLGINQSRFGLTDILSILEVPAILRRFGLDDDELQLIRRWLDDAGVRWGRDQHSRLKQGVPAFEQNSWAFGIRRLILGYALSDDAPLYLDNLVVTGVEGQSAQALGKLLNFIEVLDDTAQQFEQPQTGTARLAELSLMLDAFYATDEDEREQLQEIRDAIAALEQELLSAAPAAQSPEAIVPQHLSNELTLSIEVLQQWFNQRLTESRVGQRYLAGSVNFCTLMPMRSIPFKVVCLLGMNDGVYPRVTHPVGFDLMAHFGARKGDRSRRLDDRYLFLEALLSAREQLYISYIGRSERDNSERIASMLVSELIEYCQLCYLPENLLSELETTKAEAAETALHDAIVSHQPLQPFDPRLYRAPAAGNENANDAGIKQSYSKQWCPPNKLQPIQRFINDDTQIRSLDNLPIDADNTANMAHVDVSALIRFFRNPAQYFFNRSLKVDLSIRIQADDNDEPFGLDALERYQLQAELLDHNISQGITVAELDFIERLKAKGNLPMRPFDELLLRQYQHDISPLIGRTLFLKGEQPSHHGDIKLHFDPTIYPLGEIRTILLEGRIDDISPKGLVNYRPGSAHGRDLLRLYIRHLCLMAMGHTQASYLLDMGHFHALSPIHPEQAHTGLRDLLQLFFQGQQHPLCFMPRTSLAYAQAEGEHADKLKEAEAEWLDEQGEIGEGTEPHYQRLFQFPKDFTQARFGELAQRIYTPMVSLYHKGTLADLEDFALNEGMTLGAISPGREEGVQA
ncbi:exodeoxyribonuclease V subunit gamma [Shewanella sp. HN-41]|uniref:exodeoxyribonuclease V subunit gamma n=1 Tax=Shewanella sp. HN-41 TaxID=327275 RepID=UPI0002125912|nr:exodeoxyribonuclease V subunit gamma [Shewanella sp. HN-41]EGM70035.1 exodeoxyribonuclease V gamma chain RecC [Shewanella sp. HN-41]